MAKKDNDALDPDAQQAAIPDEIDSMVLDLDDVDENAPDFEALPPGVYDAVTDNVEYGPSKSSGNPMLTWVFRVTDPQYEGRLLFYHTVLNSDNGRKRLKQLMIRAMPEYPLKGFDPKVFVDSGEGIGRSCRVKLNIRPYKNPMTGISERRNNVQDVLAPADAGSSFLEESLE